MITICVCFFWICLTRFQVNDSTRVATSCRALQNSFRMQLSQALFLGKPWENRDSCIGCRCQFYHVLSYFIQFLGRPQIASNCHLSDIFRYDPTPSGCKSVIGRGVGCILPSSPCRPVPAHVGFALDVGKRWKTRNFYATPSISPSISPASPQHLSASMGVRFRLPEWHAPAWWICPMTESQNIFDSLKLQSTFWAPELKTSLTLDSRHIIPIHTSYIVISSIFIYHLCIPLPSVHLQLRCSSWCGRDECFDSFDSVDFWSFLWSFFEPAPWTSPDMSWREHPEAQSNIVKPVSTQHWGLRWLEMAWDGLSVPRAVAAGSCVPHFATTCSYQLWHVKIFTHASMQTCMQARPAFFI